VPAVVEKLQVLEVEFWKAKAAAEAAAESKRRERLEKRMLGKTKNQPSP
jgi:hypothetical protein